MRFLSSSSLRLAVVVSCALALGAVLAAPAQATVSLSSGYVTPTSGDTTTKLTYRVKYWNTDGVLPDAVKAAIWSSAAGTRWFTMWPLEPGDTNPVDGKWYTLSLTLAAGSYAFRFAAQTGAAWVYWPSPAGSYTAGPAVTPAAPVISLTSGYVTPASGTDSAPFTYRIKYWNSAGALPAAVKACVWSSATGPHWYTMWAFDPSDTSTADGKRYTLNLSLAVDTYSFRFAAQTGDAWVYWPSPQGSYQLGPAVAPTTSLTGGAVTPSRGDPETTFTYRIQYFDAANRPPDTGSDSKPKVNLAVYWSSNATTHWYLMSKVDPSDTDYRDGCWYKATVSGLDVTSHSYRFTAQTAGRTVEWPGGGGAQLGPQMYISDVNDIFDLYDAWEQYLEAEDLTHLMGLFRSDYLSNGKTKADKQAEYADFFATHSGIQVTDFVSQIAFAGEEARITIHLKIETDQGVVVDGVYDDWYNDELGILNVCKRDTGVWQFYGRQP